MLRKWKALGMLLFLTAVVFLNVSPTPASGQPDPTGTLADIIDRGYIKVGSDIAYPPFEDLNLDTDVAEGFDIDIMHVLAEGMGNAYQTDIAVEFVSSEWDPIIPNLQDKQFDVIMSAMTITSAREAEVDFTRWYYQSAMGVLAEAGNPLGITTTADLNDTTLTIGFQTGTTTYIWASAHLNDTSPTRLLTYDDFPLAIAALELGEVDAVMGDVAVLTLEAAQSADYEMVLSFFGDEPENFGIACRTGDTDLKAALDMGLDFLLGTDESAPVISDTYNAIFYKWHGTSHPSYTGSVTSKAIVYNWYEAPEDDDSPAFEFIAALAVLAGSALILRQRRKR
ncbi:MAG: transporter substrate-binding domain-containing protein [Candidatus Heimdallarchaeota archaeon]